MPIFDYCLPIASLYWPVTFLVAIRCAKNMSAATAGGTIVINSTPNRHSSMALDYEMGLVRVANSTAAFSSSSAGFRVRPNDVTMIAPSTPTKIVRSCPSTPTGLKTVQGSLTSIVSKLNNKRNKVENEDSVVGGDGKTLSEHDYSNGDSSVASDSHLRLRNLLVAQLDLIKKQSDAIITKDRQLRELRQENRALQQRLLNLGQTSNTSSTCETKKGTENKANETLTAKNKVHHSMTIITKDKAVETTSELLDNYIKVTNSNDSSSTIVPKISSEIKSNLIHAEKLHLPSYLETDKPYYTFQGEEFLRTEEKEIKEILSQAEVPGWRTVSVPTCYSMEGTENIEDETVLKRHNKPELDEKRRKRWDLQRLRQQRQVERLRARYDSSDPTNVNNQNHKSSFKRLQTTNKTSKGFNLTSDSPSVEAMNNLDLLNNHDSNMSNLNSYSSGSTNSKETDWLYTLQPLPELATHVQVSEKIPVNAFGFCVPMFQKQDFSLPWLNESTNDQITYQSKITSSNKSTKSKNNSTSTVSATQRGVKKVKAMKAARQKNNRAIDRHINGSTIDKYRQTEYSAK